MVFFRELAGQAMLRVFAGIIVILLGLVLGFVGLFWAWASGFATPQERGNIIALGVVGMIVGAVLMAGGAWLCLARRFRSR